MLAPFTRSPDRAAAASRVKHWTRGGFRLGGDATILVTELESATPGFPPLTTVVAFWSGTKALPLPRVQAARGRDRNRCAARVVSGSAGRDAGRRLRLLLNAAFCAAELGSG